MEPWELGKVVSIGIEEINFVVLCQLPTHFWWSYLLFIGRASEFRPQENYQVDNLKPL